MSNRTILVVDDQASFRAILKDMLEELGFPAIKEAADGLEALEVLKGGDIFLVISDYMMAPGNGLELVAAMRKEASLVQIPFILVSAASDKQVAEQAAQAGATRCLSKPLGFPKLQKELMEVLAANMS